MTQRSRTKWREAAGRGGHAPPHGPTKAKKWGIGVGLVAAVTTAGLAVSVISGGSPHSPGSASASPSTTDHAEGGQPKGKRTLDGVPVGYSRTEAGAKAAASNFATVRGSAAFLTNPTARQRATAAMSTAEVKRPAGEEANQAAAQAAKDLRGDSKKVVGKDVIARTGVFSAHTLAFNIHNATIRLWTTTVRGNTAGNSPPHAAFRSVTVNLVWDAGDWKAASFSTGRGLVAPLSSQQATNTANDFAQYVPGEAADPVLSGATNDGVPGPYTHDEAGARAAAANAAMVQGDPRFFTDADWRHRMLRGMTAPRTLKAVTHDADSTAQLVMENRQIGGDGRTVDGGRLVTRTAVLAARTLTHTSQAASVEMWTASVGGIAGKDESQHPQVGFLRMTVDLAWVDGTWKTTAVSPGEPLVPSPPAAEQASPATSFADMGGVSDAPSFA
ncbi:hypothetical protein [Streptomyces monomycini]|uniref:hypothetical protein n=1 Tax=Streptomyces monomycini TaxID=371720 RepID=UPI000B1FBB35|nr:hypothetical protein [Streptomyces monomycini]